MSEYTAAQIAEHEAWVEAELDAGRCPYSGHDRHVCHVSICDCFDSDKCRRCLDAP